MKTNFREILEDTRTALDEARFVIGGSGLEAPKGEGVNIVPGRAYFMGASSSPQFIIVTKVKDDLVFYKTAPFTGKELRAQTWVAKDLIYKGTTTQLKRAGKYMDPGLKKSLASLLKGGMGRKEDVKQYEPLTVVVAPKPKFAGKDLWRQAEAHGGSTVSATPTDDDKGYLDYEVWTTRGNLEDLKKDPHFDIVSVKKRLHESKERENSRPLTESALDVESMRNELWLIASNDGDAYRKKDAKGAVMRAWKEFLQNHTEEMREDFQDMAKDLIKDLDKKWKQEQRELRR